ncbi:HK97 family phage prohead protease [Noviherbaspirillum galbum]|uniref:HK97 family phage prohead protease n=1 Tax=Noviherbaspirillum galbum TaxID=2709383 RepID=A0A6B3SVN8_9BURK|nr:HK97 family phage prohead protease [Noviherbaspirillum galbum]NEX63455.1 HK97 family phage prohead protease [Noviherbaspirillum galbum]
MRTNTFETRSGGDLRAISTNKLTGYAAVYNSLSQDLGGFVERIMPGAFKRSLAKPDNIRALYEHDHQKTLGRVGAGTLELTENSKGLYFELTLPDTTYARDLGVLVQRGDIAGCSFGFRVPENGDRWDIRGGVLTRDLLDVELHEITITGNPAYLDTTVAVRSMEQWRKINSDRARSLEALWIETL